MASNNNNLNTLLQLFADNVVGNITASTLRTFISTVFGDKEVQINKFTTLNSFEAQPNPTIYEGSLVVIYDSTPSENGLYRATLNQAQNRQYLMQVSSASEVEGLTKITYEITATDSQNVLTSLLYTANLVDVFVNGIKYRDALITKNSTNTTNGTNLILNVPLELNDIVEIVCYTK